MASRVRIAYRKEQASKYMIEVLQEDGTWKERYRFSKKNKAEDIMLHFFNDSVIEKEVFKYK